MKTPTIHLLKLQNVSIFAQLQLEEALLRADDRNWILFNTGSPPAAVMGISGKMEKLINLPYLEQNPIPLIRRFSGGGTVVVDSHTLFFTVICRRDDLAVPPFPQKIMQWAGTLLSPLFEKNDFAVMENDYILGNKKFGGNALYITQNRWLLHTSFLWDFEETMMQYLLPPEKQPLYRQKRSHSDFLCRLKDKFLSQEFFIESLLQQLRGCFVIQKGDYEEAASTLLRPHRKSTELLPVPALTAV